MNADRSSWRVKVGLVASVFFAVYCLKQALPLGMAGDPGMRKWFGLFFGAMVASIWLASVRHIQINKQSGAEQYQVEAETLAAAARMKRQSAERKDKGGL